MRSCHRAASSVRKKVKHTMLALIEPIHWCGAEIMQSRLKAIAVQGESAVDWPGVLNGPFFLKIVGRLHLFCNRFENKDFPQEFVTIRNFTQCYFLLYTTHK